MGGGYIHVMNLQLSPGTTEEIPTGFPQSKEESFLWLEIATVDETSPDPLRWYMAPFRWYMTLCREHHEAPCSGSLAYHLLLAFSSSSIRKPPMFHFLKILVWKVFFFILVLLFFFNGLPKSYLVGPNISVVAKVMKSYDAWGESFAMVGTASVLSVPWVAHQAA